MPAGGIRSARRTTGGVALLPKAGLDAGERRGRAALNGLTIRDVGADELAPYDSSGCPLLNASSPGATPEPGHQPLPTQRTREAYRTWNGYRKFTITTHQGH